MNPPADLATIIPLAVEIPNNVAIKLLSTINFFPLIVTLSLKLAISYSKDPSKSRSFIGCSPLIS